MCNDRKWLVSGICTFPACVFFSVSLLSSGFRPCPSFCVQPRQTFYIRLLFSDFLFTTLPNYHMIRWSLIWARIVLLFAKHYDIASFANVQDIVVLLLLVSRVAIFMASTLQDAVRACASSLLLRWWPENGPKTGHTCTALLPTCALLTSRELNWSNCFLCNCSACACFFLIHI